MEFRYLHIGSSDTGSDVARWLALPGTSLRWCFRHFGADAAAIDPGYRPLVLIADHRPAGSVLPIYGVVDLEAARARLVTGGWALEMSPMGTPEGPACIMQTPSGTTIAVLQGVGAAPAAPPSLALLTTIFSEGPQRVREIGLFTTVSPAGGAIGLVAGECRLSGERPVTGERVQRDRRQRGCTSQVHRDTDQSEQEAGPARPLRAGR